MDWLNRAVVAIRPKGPADNSTGAFDSFERTYSRRVVDLAMRVAETMLTVGASVDSGTVTALQIVKAYGVTPVHVDITYTSITVSYHRDIDEDPLTLSRVLRARTTDYTRLQRLEELTEQIDAGLDVDEARRRYNEITSAPHPYRRAIVTVANGILGAGASLLLGGSWFIAVLALCTGAMVVIVQHELSRRLLPAFFIQTVGAFVATMVAMAAITLSRNVDWIGEVRPSIIVSAAIVMLFAGMAVVGAAQDAIDGFYLTAGARIFEVVLLTLGIVFGIAVGLTVASAIGYGFELPTGPPPIPHAGQQLLGAALIAVGYTLSAYGGGRTLLLGTGIALIAYLAFLTMRWFGLEIAPSCAVGALTASFLSILVARNLHVPSLALTTAGIVPFVPGSAVFRGLQQLYGADGDVTRMINGATTLSGAIGVGLAIAAGVSLGAYFGRPTRNTIATAVRRLRGPA
ncbi:threonine/serine ThrE exporter family protein [Cumulibacter soli]|uniref:threonine/serine ThrE exporter family protein n=1 Tax=Cumulibacter soli TaxID=2546344 RepID=UPI00141960C3|nr:threonine/serine exporter family protein [Cumulibacter soli]